MALGFQDCCNSSSYFFLNGIPATVSQNEFYHIITLEGPAFCATYTNIPALNYQPPTYTLIEMTEYTSCDTCFVGASLTCPAQETIFLSQFGAGSISVGTDCTIKTIFPMIVECFSTNPTFDGFADGVVRVFVTGGTPPYSFFNVVDGTVYGGNIPVENSIYTLIDGALEGTYIIRVVDAQGDYNIIVYCVLESPPTELTVTRNPTQVSAVDVCDGTIVVGIADGTPPYQIFVNGFPTSDTTLVDLCAGDYDITVIDSGVGLDQQINSGIISVGQPNVITYPDNLCLSFTFCNTLFNLTFTRQGSFNNRASYTCDNPGDVGLTILLLRWINGWTTTQQTSNGNLNFTSPCAQPLTSTQIQFSKISSNTEQPTGSWQSPLGMFQGISANVVQGVCVPSGGGGGGGPVAQPTLTFTTSNAQCGQALGQVTLIASGGAGAPYQYLIGGIVQTSQTVQLAPGNYNATVIDNNNTQSSAVNFTIGQNSPQNITMDLSIAVQSGQIVNGPISVNGNVAGCNASTGVNCINVYDTYQPVKISVDLNGLPSGQVVLGYFKVKTKYQGVFNDTYIEGVWSPTSMVLTSANKNSTSLTSTVALISNTTSPRPNSINTNLLTAAQSQSCPSNPAIYYSKTTVREYTIGSAGTPISINNTDVIEFSFDVTTRININNNNGCQPATGLEFDVEFVKTSPNITCYNFLFNGGTIPYVASAKQVGTQTTITPYTNVTIING
jgi:hypothetical protein